MSTFCHLLCRVGPTTFYSIIVDGTTDSSSIDQLCFLIRYFDPHEYETREDFLCFVPTTSSACPNTFCHV